MCKITQNTVNFNIRFGRFNAICKFVDFAEKFHISIEKAKILPFGYKVVKRRTDTEKGVY